MRSSHHGANLSPIAGFGDSVFLDHFQHLQVTFDDGNMMLEYLNSSGQPRASDRSSSRSLTSGHGMCRAGRGPPPVHLFVPHRNPPPFASGPGPWPESAISVICTKMAKSEVEGTRSGQDVDSRCIYAFPPNQPCLAYKRQFLSSLSL